MIENQSTILFHFMPFEREIETFMESGNTSCKKYFISLYFQLLCSWNEFYRPYNTPYIFPILMKNMKDYSAEELKNRKYNCYLLLQQKT